MLKPMPEPGFWVIIWKGVKVPAAFMLIETIKFVILLSLLIVVYWFLKGLGAAGYAEDRLQRFETIHYYASLLLSCVFVFDLFLKFIFSSTSMEQR
jgi:hypothetical protein